MTEGDAMLDNSHPHVKGGILSSGVRTRTR